jgi:hypothetical protein
MSSFSRINTALTTIVTAQYPAMLQIVGTPDQVAAQELSQGQDIFAIYANYSLVPNEIEGVTETTENFGFYVGRLDTFDSVAPAQNAITAACDEIANVILAEFYNAVEGNNMWMNGIKKTPLYKRGADTNSGVWVTASITVVVPCLV